MFEKELAARIQRIFDFPKVTYDRASESKEQKAIFIEIDQADVRIRDKRAICKVEGTLRAFAQSSVLPFGYMAKKIAESNPADSKAFWFGSEQNLGTIVNLVERKMAFTFLFDSEYDPSTGTITSITTSYAET